MKKVLFILLFAGWASTAAQAQNSAAAAVAYAENVLADGAGKEALYNRAAEWSTSHFAYGPKTGAKTDAATGMVRVTGTGKVKPVTPAGKEQEMLVRFDFVFRASETGYEYSVGSFRLVADPNKPEESVMLSDYITQLAAERSNTRTFNDRRVTAQATALASEVAMSFRSYMNTLPSAEEGMVGVPGAGKE
ncbi:DUF4468 domain-containing protein [Hymenobacter elongatus]|uniref:DUF4468 domain-containing protein n=1 Tax=Hymenobacter elongatus TaxID=877208 RepID=A0A4Z0PHQ5_9BACT|nr:DUF4468 domain-containing protein [Hymenobacter elongatus]TGE14761.1 DUF4468 domain-containing protein [Hymenobacter elongatus]